jgi:hypothetical protein
MLFSFVRIRYDKLVYGMERGECILFLGPQLPLDRGDGMRRIPAEDLAARLLEQLDDRPKSVHTRLIHLCRELCIFLGGDSLDRRGDSRLIVEL